MNILLLQHIAILLVRIVLAIVFLYFGLPKIKNLKNNAKDFEGMGFKPGWLFGTGIAVLEVVGGIMIGLGFMSWIFAGLIFIHMIVGTVWKIGWTDKKFPDWSYDIILAALALIVISFGSGLLSIDYIIFSSIV